MGTIEVFDHTADVGLIVRGDSLVDLFQTAAEGVFDYIIVNREAVRPEHHESFNLAAETTGDLLVLWLNELIFRSETGHTLFTTFDLTLNPTGTKLVATISGEPIDRDRHILDHEVKAVTHHAFKVEREGEGWVAELILDI